MSKGPNFANIVSVGATADGRATVWRRVGGALVREEDWFRPWVLLDSTADLPRGATVRELSGPGALRAVRNLEKTDALVLPAEELRPFATGRTCFQGLIFDDLRGRQYARSLR